jgi:hypothetical protein
MERPAQGGNSQVDGEMDAAPSVCSGERREGIYGGWTRMLHQYPAQDSPSGIQRVHAQEQLGDLDTRLQPGGKAEVEVKG